MSFTHLSTPERSELYNLRVIEQLSISEIGRRLKRNKSTISRKLSRNTDARQIGYLPDTADALMKARRKQAKVKFQCVSAKTIAEVKTRNDRTKMANQSAIKHQNRQ